MDDEAPETLSIGREAVTDPCDQGTIELPSTLSLLPATTTSPQKGGCVACGSADLSKRYKCPKCRSPYCSLGCSNHHKEKCSGRAVDIIAKSQREPISGNLACHKRPYDELDLQAEENGWRLKPEETALLAQSSSIQQMLRDPSLRDLVCQVRFTCLPHVLNCLPLHSILFPT
jgi:hypothetical protein